MLKRFKRLVLKRKISKLEDYAASKKMWGSNITTMVVINELVGDHYDNLFNQSAFIDIHNAKVISSSFGNIEGMIGWLRDVKVLLLDVVNNHVKEIPNDKQHLNITELNDVSVNDFIRDSNGYMVDLNKVNKTIHRLITDIGNICENISSNRRNYYDMRLVNGMNTVLVFNELILRAMTNGE